MIKILMVEDDEGLAHLLKRFMEDHGVSVTSVVKPSVALDILKSQSFDVIILDLSLPEMDGLVLCKKIRSFSDVGIIISSARGDIVNKLEALDTGADDYLPKPYDPRELLARIKVLHKRLSSDKDETNSLFRVDENSTQIYHSNKALELTKAEYEILKLFLNNQNQTLSRVDIANSINSHRFDSGVDSINVLIARLRKKIEETPQQYICTVRSVGYRFVCN